MRDGLVMSHLIGFKNDSKGQGIKIGFIFSNYRTVDVIMARHDF